MLFSLTSDSRRLLVGFLHVALASVVFSHVGYAQKNDLQKDAIELTEIAIKSEETQNEILQIKKELEDREDINKIQDSYVNFVKSLDQSKESFLDDKNRYNTLSRLEEPERFWMMSKNTIDAWLTAVQNKIHRYDAGLKRLEYLDKIWQNTLSAARSNKAPTAILQRIRLILQDVKKTKSEVKSVLNGILTLQSKMAETDLLIKEMLNSIEKLKKEAGASLFTLNNPPIWEAFDEREISGFFTETVYRGVLKRYQVLIKYILDYYYRFFYQLFIFFVLSFLFVSSKRRCRTHSPEEEVDPGKDILRWPFTLAFLFSLGMTPVIHPHAPYFMVDLSLFLMLFPLLHILPRLLSSFYQKILYFFILSFSLSEISSLVIPGSLFQRLISMGLTIAAVIFLYGILRYQKISKQVSGKKLAVVLHWAGRLAIVLLAIALAANIIGAFALAQFLVHGVLFSGFMATVISVGVLAVNQLWNVFLHLDFVQSYRSISQNSEIIRVRFNKIMYWLAMYWWLVQTLKVFQLYEGFKGAFLSVVGYRLTVGSFAVSLGDVLIFSVTIFLSVLISRFIRFVLEEDVLRKVKLPRGVGGSISMLTHYAILIIGFTIAVSAAGIEWSRFALIAGALGVGIGFGLQDVVNNFVSGLILIFERPVKLGDVIELADLRGNVKRIGIRSSTIRTFEGAEVIVPNSHLISEKLVNWTLSDRLRRISIPVGVAYGTNPKTVIGILEKIAEKNEDVLEKPAPSAVFMGFGESSLDFELRFWTRNFDDWVTIRTNISIQINEALAKKGIEIPFPQRDIHIISNAQDDPPDIRAERDKKNKDKKK